MIGSTSFETSTFRVVNPSSKKAFFLTAQDDGAMLVSEVSPDPSHCPDLLQDPVYTPSPAFFTTGVPTITRFEFDGNLGADSTVSLNSGAGVVSTISLSGSMLTFQYTAAMNGQFAALVMGADQARVFVDNDVVGGDTPRTCP